MAPTEGAGAAAQPAAAPAPAAAPVTATPSAPPSVIVARLDAGTAAAGIEAAEPRSTAPLRILVTRRTQHDRIIDAQYTLADLGYLERHNFDGTLGKATVNAIKAFQKDDGLPPTGAFNEQLVAKLYAVAGKKQSPIGQLFVRQEFGRMFDAPVDFRNPDEPLGTHVFTAMKFAPGDTKTQWMAVSLVGDDPAAVLDRLEIPAGVRQKISERLTPGSSLIIGDLAINSATLPKGADFLVWAKDLPAKVTAASLDSEITQPRAKKKKYRSTVKHVKKRTYTYQYPRPAARGYPGWPW
jgi:hypothetical protein